MYKYEDLSNVDPVKSVSAADKILQHGWSRRNYPLVQLDAIPWQLNNPEERSWNFYIHCLDMLDSLLKAYDQTSDVQYLKPTLEVAKDWIHKHKNMDANSTQSMAWYDMAVGLRSYRLAYIFDALEREGLLVEEDSRLVWTSLEQHACYLSNDENIIFHNNHGFYQVAGQLAMGRRFASRSEVMSRAYEQGRGRLRGMLNQQFTKDGVHREHSPDYHRMVCDTLRAMVASSLISDEEIVSFVNRIEESLSWFVMPNRHIANFGDSDYRLLARKPLEAQRKWSSAAMQYVVSGGAVGELPDSERAIFEEGGYFIIRKPINSDPESFSKSSYLAQIAAFHSRTHKHADDLSFIWSEFGQDILVDAGRYGYLGKAKMGSKLWLDGYWYSDPNRVYCESTRAHNTLEFNGKNNKRKGVEPYGCAIKRVTQTEEGIHAVETEIKQHGSIRHARVLVINPGKWLLVFDWFHDNKKKSHSVKQWFHLAPSLSLVKEGESYVTQLPGADRSLKVVSLLKGPVASRCYLGEEKSGLQGWWSAKERDIVPNYTFCYESEKLRTGSFATLFSFSDELVADVKWSQANVSGRSIRLRWNSDGDCHTLKLGRDQDGELSVDYAVG